VPGSAPDLAGKGIANPIARIRTGVMMPEQLARADAAGAVVSTIEPVVEEGKVLTRDLGGQSMTAEVGQAIAAAI